jgi:hypothetical protein
MKRNLNKARQRFAMSARRLLPRLESSTPIKAIQLAGIVFAAVIAAQGVYGLLTSYYEQVVGWKATEQSNINKLAPNESLEYVTSVLGTPQLKLGKVAGYQKYIFKERGYWVVAYVNDDSTVKHLIFTSCQGDDLKPVIRSNPVGPPIKLGESTLSSVRYDTHNAIRNKDDYKRHYFMRAATAPTYYIDEHILGAASNYQNVYVGHVEFCGGIKLPEDINSTLVSSSSAEAFSDDQLKIFRSGIIINTYGISAPFEKSLYEIEPNIELSVSSVNAGVLNACSLQEHELFTQNSTETDRIKNRYAAMKDFEVHNFSTDRC